MVYHSFAYFHIDPNGCISAGDAYSYPLLLSTYFNEPEGETLIFTLTKTPNTATESWLFIFNNSTHLTFSGNPSSINIGNLTANVLVDDSHGISTTNFTLDFCVRANTAPDKIGNPTFMPNATVGLMWNYDFLHSWVTDADGDSLTYSRSANTSIPWLICTDTASAYS